MVRRLTIAGCVLFLALPLCAQQQENSTPPPQTQSGAQKQSGQKAPPQKKSSSSNQNAFPEAQSEKAAQQAQQQDGSPAPPPTNAAPDAPAPQPKKSAADQNPFPEAKSQNAAQQAQQQDQSPAADKQSPHDYSSSQDALKGLDLSGQNASNTSDGAGGSILSPDLGRKDTKVGQFYLHSGDYKGAYDRFAEATKVAPGNADAVFGLAEAARHLNMRAQAISNYQLYLSALPDGPRAKDARKALRDLGVEPKS